MRKQRKWVEKEISQRSCVSKGLTRAVIGAPVILGEVHQREGVVLEISPLHQERRLLHFTRPPSPPPPLEEERQKNMTWEGVSLTIEPLSTIAAGELKQVNGVRVGNYRTRKKDFRHHAGRAPQNIYFEFLFSDAQNARENSVSSTCASAAPSMWESTSEFSLSTSSTRIGSPLR